MTTVDIYGRSYNISSQSEPKTIQALARHVDRRMRQLAKQVEAGDTVGAAVLAALNIADEYYRTREALERRDREVSERTRGLEAELRQALGPVNEEFVRPTDE